MTTRTVCTIGRRPGRCEYRLEIISMKGVHEDYPLLGGPVAFEAGGLAFDVLNDEGVDAAGTEIETSSQIVRAQEICSQFAAAPKAPVISARALNERRWLRHVGATRGNSGRGCRHF